MRIVHSVRRWGTRATFSILDQGLFSGANFIFNILLVRWLLPSEYGAFVVAFSLFLFGSGFHNALLLEPLTVLGAKRKATDLDQYLGQQCWLHLGFSAIVTALLLLIGFGLVAVGSSVGRALLSAALCAPFILFHWLLRRACYLDYKVTLATISSALYASILVSSLLIIQLSHNLSVARSFWIFAFASTITGVFLIFKLNIHRHLFSENQRLDNLKRIALENWNYGRWSSGSTVVSWISTTAYTPLIGSTLGLAQAGAFRAMQNLVQPLQQLLVALNLLWLPHFSKTYQENSSALTSAFRTSVQANLFMSLGYLGALLPFSTHVIDLLYGAETYTEYTFLLYYFGCFMLLMAMRQAYTSVLMAMLRPDTIFRAQVVSATFTLSIGLAILYAFELTGALVSMVVGTGSALCVLVHYWRMLKPSQHS